jgi:hypothetical protein
MYTKMNRIHYLSYNVIIIGFFSVTRTPHHHHYHHHHYYHSSTFKYSNTTIIEQGGRNQDISRTR